MPRRVPILIGLILATSASAQDAPRQFRLHAEESLVSSGLMDYLLPRFALKTGRRAELVADLADIALTDQPSGDGIFEQSGRIWYLDRRSGNNAGLRFADWLSSDIGLRTVESFVPTTKQGYRAVVEKAKTVSHVFEGDAKKGAEVAALHCARCHRVSPDDRNSIGSTPSFMALKALADWADRFGAFYALNPHPAFMLVKEISPEFDPARPPSIVPIRLTLDEVEAIQAYVSSLAPANLGAPVAAN
jgi:mono/diheme cytochrome c family protein